MLIRFVVYLPLLKNTKIAQRIVLILFSYIKCRAESLFCVCDAVYDSKYFCEVLSLSGF